MLFLDPNAEALWWVRYDFKNFQQNTRSAKPTFWGIHQKQEDASHQQKGVSFFSIIGLPFSGPKRDGFPFL